MKPRIRDYLTVLSAFIAVFLCGYGVGHLVSERNRDPSPGTSGSTLPPAWRQETLSSMTKTLGLRPAQLSAVERELDIAAEAIRKSHDTVILDYHLHVDRLYERLIEVLDEEQAARLRREKKLLEKRIESLSP